MLRLRSSIILLILAVSFIFPADSHAGIKILSRFDGNRPVGIYVKDGLLYTLDRGKGFQVWDISDLKNIRKIGQYDKAKDAIWQAKPDFIKYEGGYGNPKGGAYGADYGGFNQIWGMGMGTFGGKELAFIRCAHQGIQVLDATDPTRIFNMGGRPDLQKNIEAADNSGMHIAVKGDNIFRSYWGGFQVFRYSPAAALKNMGPYEYVSEIREGPAGAANDIKISKDDHYMYIAGDNAMDVYGISNVRAPKIIYTYYNIRRPYQKIENKGICVATGNKLLFLGTSKDMRIFNISDMTKIKPLTDAAGKEIIYPSLGSVLDIKIYKNYAFLYYGPTEDTKSSAETGLEIIDISDPREPKFVDAFVLGKADWMEYFRKMALISKKGIIIVGADAFYILDVSDYVK